MTPAPPQTTAASPRAELALVVEDDDRLAQSYAAALAPWAKRIERAASVADARCWLPALRPDLLLVDIALPDGTAADVLNAAQALDRIPAAIVISGSATPVDTFALAQQGARAFLPKPITLAALEAAIATALAGAPDLAPHLRVTVGRRPVREVEDEVRRVMVKEALGQAAGSRRGAARLLAVSRQLLQHMVRALDEAP
jgi:two-component system, response regulator RegA